MKGVGGVLIETVKESERDARTAATIRPQKYDTSFSRCVVSAAMVILHLSRNWRSKMRISASKLPYFNPRHACV